MKKTMSILILLTVFILSCLVLTGCFHIHVFGEWTVVSQATCTESGFKEGVCRCGEKKIEIIESKGHTYSAWSVVVEPTCTDAGVDKRACACGNVETRNTQPMGHSTGKWIVDSEPTCTQQGSKHQVCSVCETTVRTESIETISHTFSNWSVVQEPTCVQNGQKERECFCGEKEIADIPTTAHTVVIDSEVAATCTTTGLTEGQHCFVCDTVIVEQKTMAPLGHNWGAWTQTKAPTLLVDGQEKRVCTHDSNHTETRKVSATGNADVKAFYSALSNTSSFDNYSSSFSVSFKLTQLLVFTTKIQLSGSLNTIDEQTYGSTVLSIGNKSNQCTYEYPIYNRYDVPYARLMLENGKYIYFPTDVASTKEGIIITLPESVLGKIQIQNGNKNSYVAELTNEEVHAMYGKILQFFVDYASDTGIELGELSISEASIQAESTGDYIYSYTVSMNGKCKQGKIDISLNINITPNE